jgi:hypothetical protein
MIDAVAFSFVQNLFFILSVFLLSILLPVYI